MERPCPVRVGPVAAAMAAVDVGAASREAAEGDGGGAQGNKDHQGMTQRDRLV